MAFLFGFRANALVRKPDDNAVGLSQRSPWIVHIPAFKRAELPASQPLRRERCVKIKVDSSKCQGHALCAAVSERLFHLDDEGYSAVTSWTEVAPEDEKAARLGQVACPERAIEIRD
jgi:ferredoxin